MVDKNSKGQVEDVDVIDVNIDGIDLPDDEAKDETPVDLADNDTVAIDLVNKAISSRLGQPVVIDAQNDDGIDIQSEIEFVASYEMGNQFRPPSRVGDTTGECSRISAEVTATQTEGAPKKRASKSKAKPKSKRFMKPAARPKDEDNK